MTAKTTLTDLFLKKTKAPTRGQVDIWDSKIPGFGVRVAASGLKTFGMVYRYRGAWRRDTLGRYPSTSLLEARTKAERARVALRDGLDPRTQRQTSRPAPKGQSFDEAAAAFVAGYLKHHTRPSTSYEAERILRAVFLPVWTRRRLADLQAADVLAVLDAITARGTPSAARHAFAVVRKFFNWCVERQMLPASPCAGLKPPAKANARERVLTRPEIAAVWHAATAQGYPFGDIVRLLMLTAQRRAEVSGMQWDELDEGAARWTIPGDRTKNGKPHAVPLSAAALDLLAQIPRTASPYVFPARGKPGQPFTGWSKAKRTLDAAANQHGWTLHDLRRTAATGMALNGTPPHVVERVLNHVSGTFAGVAGIYNRHQYADEMRAALDDWAQMLDAITAEGLPADSACRRGAAPGPLDSTEASTVGQRRQSRIPTAARSH